MKKKKILLGICVFLIAGVWIVHKYRSNDFENAPKIIWVQATPVKESTLPLEAKAIGTLVARSVDITPEIAGHLQKILFQDGLFVKKDTPLFQLDDAVAKTKYELAKAKLSYSEMNFNRTKMLEKKGVLAKQALEQADADLKEKKADAKESEVMLSKMKLTAPFDGMLGKAKVNPGDYLTIGQSLVTITDTRHLHVEYNLSEKNLANVKLGQKVKITTTAYPQENFYGTVAFISPTVNPDNRTILLYAEVENEKALLAPGMFVNVTQSLGSEKKALMIPARSLVPVLNGEQVYRIVDGKAYGVTVLIGKRTKEQVQVIEGLSSGDVVITDGQLKVKNGMPVSIKT